jgi:hemolysin activation/secretion protein
LTIPPGPKYQQKTPKFKIEFDDPSGARYSFSVEGEISKENITKMVDFVNQLSYNQDTSSQNTQPDYSNIDTNFSRVYGLLETKFKFGSFSSSDVLEAYEQEFDAQTTLSTISTYLSRLTHRGLLSRIRNGSGWIYKLIRLAPQGQILVTEQEKISRPNLLTS